jgi:predicted ABC-type ATPase
MALISKKKLIIVAGPNGSGKTTLAKEVLRNQKIKFLNADEIAAKINPKDVNAVKYTAGKKFLNLVRSELKKKNSFAIESTLSGQFLLDIVKEAKSKKYSVQIIYIFLESSRVSIERIRVRVLKGGHHIPDADVIRRFTRSKNNFWKIYREQADSWQIIYNGEDRPIQVASGSRKLVSILNEELFAQFSKDITK